MLKFRADIEVYFDAPSQEVADELADLLGDVLSQAPGVTAVANGPAVAAS